MVRSSDVVVVASKYVTEITFIVYVPEAAKVPFEISVDGYLTAPERAGAPVPGRNVNIYLNGVLIDTLLTDIRGFYWRDHIPITVPGTYIIYSEFEGDEMYEGCEEVKTQKPSLIPLLILAFTILKLI